MYGMRSATRLWVVISILVTVRGAMDVSMKALIVPCDTDVYQPPEIHKSLTKCQRKIQVLLLINNTGKGSKGTGFVHVTRVYEPEFERTSRLFNTIVIRLRRDNLLLAYPFRYLTTVNEKISESYKVRTSCDIDICGHHTASLLQPKGYCCNCEPGNNCTVHCLNYSKFWYFVCLLSRPVIKQNWYIKLFVETQHAAKRWNQVMPPKEELSLSAEQPEDSDQQNTVIASFLSDKASESDLVLKNYKKVRVLIPCPTPGVAVSQLPSVYAEGSDNILLVPSSVPTFKDISECLNDTTTYKTGNHCHPTYNKCFEEQPQDIFVREEAKRKAGRPTPVLLSFYRHSLPEAPILYNASSGERFLTFLYRQPHMSLIVMEINADNLTLVRESTKGRINGVSSRSTHAGSYIRVQVSNLGIAPAIFTVQATQCTHGVANSDTDTTLLTPQQSTLLLLVVHFGDLDIRNDINCTVELHDSEFGLIASRLVTLRPKKLCHCYLSCRCSCAGEKVDCQLMHAQDAVKAGVYKNRTTRDDHAPRFAESHSTLVATAAILLTAGKYGLAP
ncbi:hapless 2-like isoform X2 [Ornithodoros turicata]|uniref:hapless 2-like isoform X2 n=1 Tax=Ornithodoros turicata TaxID=34597 RepID=UPI003138F352